MAAPVIDIRSRLRSSGKADFPRPHDAVALPIIVDLDGTLTATDTLHEGFLQALFRRPAAALGALGALGGGRAAFKQRTAAVAMGDCRAIPFRSDLVDYLQRERAVGASIHLVTAADQSIADAVAGLTGLFDTATGSDGRNNLKGPNKLRYLQEQFPNGFTYAGDSSADLHVWKKAAGAILAGAGLRHEAALTAAGIPIIARFPDPKSSILTWLKLFRVRRWSKNLLIFLPLLFSGAYIDANMVLETSLGFLLFGLVASGCYVINDIADLENDRGHPAKYSRPIANCTLPAMTALMVAAMLISVGLIGALLLKPAFALVVFGYLALNISYSIWLKQIPFLDVATLAGLLLSRIAAGLALADWPSFS